MKKKKLWLVTGVAAAAVLAAGTVTFAYQSGSDSEEQAVYKEVTVEKGNLTAGVTESGSVTIGTLDQTLDFSEDSSSASTQNNSSAQNSAGENATSSTSTASTLEVETVYVTAGQTVAEGDPILKLTEESVASYKKDLEEAVTEAKTAVSEAGLSAEKQKVSASYSYNLSTAEGSVAQETYKAAIKQLQVVGAQLDIPVFEMGQTNPVDIAKAAVAHAIRHGNDMVFLDTAGRLHVDEALMDELKAVKAAVNPDEILLVVDAMTGQDAVSAAKTFDEYLDITGVMLSKLDGDARGGAALSIKAVTGKPIKFIGTGEKLDQIEPFHPGRMASRILGMGDMLTLIEKAEAAFDQKKAAELEQKLRSNKFTVQTSNVADRNQLRTFCLTSTSVCTVTKAQFIHFAQHSFRTACSFHFTLR